ncbi:alpha-amylase [Endozoicomonas sp. 8E]|nr:alpha-amylase [Endozoicomonas sp. 8E]WOG28755.1 alpha-amylase [Endozoicomonas sp. 8E]
MAKKIDPEDNQANQKNPNTGTDGTNRQYDQAQGNRGKELNPNQKPTSGE